MSPKTNLPAQCSDATVIGEPAADGLAFIVVVDGDGIGELVLLPPVQHFRGQFIQLIERAALPDHAVLPVALALHPAVVPAVADDVDLLDVVHADVVREHRSVGEVPRQPMSIPESVGVDLAQRLRVAVGGELVGWRDRVVPESFHPLRHRRTARIEPQDRGDDRVETLRLSRIVGIRPAAVAESKVAAARVEQTVVFGARLGRRVEARRIRTGASGSSRHAQHEAAHAACPRTCSPPGCWFSTP